MQVHYKFTVPSSAVAGRDRHNSYAAIYENMSLTCGAQKERCQTRTTSVAARLAAQSARRRCQRPTCSSRPTGGVIFRWRCPQSRPTSHPRAHPRARSMDIGLRGAARHRVCVLRRTFPPMIKVLRLPFADPPPNGSARWCSTASLTAKAWGFSAHPIL